MSMVRELREFAVKGNVVDLAVAVIIGGAFGKIVASLVSDIVMPLAGVLLGGLDFKGLAWQVGDATVLYGRFIQVCVDFVIIAGAILLAVNLINRFRKKAQDEPPTATPPRQEQLLEEIRDLLKQKS